MAEAGQGFGAGRHAIEGIGGGGFLFGGTSHVGSILALPSGVHAWAATSIDLFNPADVALIATEGAEVDFLLIGTGERFAAPPAAVLQAIRDAGLRFEIMSTSAAAQTYNILLAEDRKVAAALIAVR